MKIQLYIINISHNIGVELGY